MKVAALLLLFASVAAAQDSTGVIWGTITDGTTGEPLPGANVLVIGTMKGAAADIEGRYAIRDVPYGEWSLRVTFIGYTSLEIVQVVLNADSVRVDATLSVSCEHLYSNLPVMYPRGQIGDLVGVDPFVADDTPSRRSRLLVSSPHEPIAGALARTPAWGRGADRLGRWRPVMGGGGSPRLYLGGLPTLSLEAVPLQSVAFGSAFPGYVPVRYGGSAAGVVDVRAVGYDRSSYPDRSGGVGGSGGGPAAQIEANANHRTTYPDCSFRQVTAIGDISGASGERPFASGRALAEHYTSRGAWTPALRAGGYASDLGQTAQAAAVLAREADWDTPIHLAAGADTEWGSDGTSALAALRSEVGGVTDATGLIGIESSIQTRPTEAGRVDQSTLAFYLDLSSERTDYYTEGVDFDATVGLRTERLGISTPTTSRAVWTVQPRALVSAEHEGRLAYAYGVILSGLLPDATLLRRYEVGGGASVDWWETGGVPMRVGVHGYARRWVGAAGQPVVYGLDGEVGLNLPLSGSPHSYPGYSVALFGIVRARHEWGDLARDRWTASLALDVQKGPPLLNAMYGAFLDIGEGVGQARVVEVGASWEPRRWRLPVALHGRGVVSGRDAIPCVGWEAIAEVACPAPSAEAALTVYL